MATKKMAVGGMSGRAMPTQASTGLDRAAAMSGRTFSKGGISTAKMGAVKAGGIKKHGEHAVQAKGHTKGKQVAMKGSTPLGMKKGGKC